MMAHHVRAMRTIFMEIGFSSRLFLLIELAVLVGIVFFQDFLLEFSLASFKCCT